MQLNGNLAVNAFVNHVVQFNQRFGVDVFAEIYFGVAASAAAARYFNAALTGCKNILQTRAVSRSAHGCRTCHF